MKKLLLIAIIAMFATSCTIQKTSKGYKNVWETKNGKMRKMKSNERPTCMDSWLN